MIDPYGDLDVVVVGGGSAGSTAAIAAARGGARTLLIDALPFLGGTSTAVLDTFYGFYTPGARSLLVVGGIAGEVVDGLRALGPVVERPNTYGAGTGITYVPDHLKVVWEGLVTRAGARVLLHATVVGAEVEDGRLTAIVVATRGGLRTVRANVFIDASGDADLCHHAGFGYELAGAEAPAQTATTTFRMVNVDMAARRAVTKDQLHALMAAAAADGYDLPRREGSDHVTPVDGMTATIMTRLDQVRRDDDGRVRNAPDPDVLTELEMAGRRQALEYVRFLVDRVPGLRERLAGGLRDTRRCPRDAPGPRRLPRDRRGRAGRAPVRRPDRTLRRPDRGPPRRWRRWHDVALPARRSRRRDPAPLAHRPRRDERARRRSLLLGDARGARLDPLDGAVHGHGPGGRDGRRDGRDAQRRRRPGRPGQGGPRRGSGPPARSCWLPQPAEVAS